MAKSINGWEVIQVWGPELVSGEVPGTDIRLSMRKSVLPLFLALAQEYNKTVAPLRKGECGAWNPRRARMAMAWSDHASGTAVDLNWNHEGAMGAHGGMSTMSAKEIEACVAIKKKFQIVIWGGDSARGGDYTNPKAWDPMHYALKPGTTQADVDRVIKELNIQPNGTIKPNKPITLPPVIPNKPGLNMPNPPVVTKPPATSKVPVVAVADVQPGKRNPSVSIVQAALVKAGKLKAGSYEVGYFDKPTTKAYAAWQTSMGAKPPTNDGSPGLKTLTQLAILSKSFKIKA
jgi:hypothetical protein